MRLVWNILRELFAAIGLAAVLLELAAHHFTGKWFL